MRIPFGGLVNLTPLPGWRVRLVTVLAVARRHPRDWSRMAEYLWQRLFHTLLLLLIPSTIEWGQRHKLPVQDDIAFAKVAY